MSRAGSRRGAGTLERDLNTKIDFEAFLKTHEDPNLYYAWLILFGRAKQDEKYTWAWAVKTLNAFNKGLLAAGHAKSFWIALSKGDVKEMCAIAQNMGPYTVKKEPIAAEISGSDGEKLEIVMNFGGDKE